MDSKKKNKFKLLKNYLLSFVNLLILDFKFMFKLQYLKKLHLIVKIIMMPTQFPVHHS